MFVCLHTSAIPTLDSNLLTWTATVSIDIVLSSPLTSCAGWLYLSRGAQTQPLHTESFGPAAIAPGSSKEAAHVYSNEALDSRHT